MRQSSWVALFVVFFAFTIVWVEHNVEKFAPTTPQYETIAGEVELAAGMYRQFPIVIEVEHHLGTTPVSVSVPHMTEQVTIDPSETWPFFLNHRGLEYAVDIPAGLLTHDGERYQQSDEYNLIRESLSVPVGNIYPQTLRGQASVSTSVQSLSRDSFLLVIRPSVSPYMVDTPTSIGWEALVCDENCDLPDDEEDQDSVSADDALVSISTRNPIVDLDLVGDLWPKALGQYITDWQWERVGDQGDWENIYNAPSDEVITVGLTEMRRPIRGRVNYSVDGESFFAYSLPTAPVDSGYAHLRNVSDDEVLRVGDSVSCGRIWRYDPFYLRPPEFPPNYVRPFPLMEESPDFIPDPDGIHNNFALADFYVADPDADLAWQRVLRTTPFTYELTESDLGKWVMCVNLYYAFPHEQPDVLNRTNYEARQNATMSFSTVEARETSATSTDSRAIDPK